ncbi:DUF5702 domain-containing protein [Sinanaerobacter sp. ZZT-01]|uniref:DUF5702 domain-containing protein n=1 Tax=Sinanaerobacter sp. ZZT-01 TaxID=3111540 RepID=UPI002D780E78|nr:DUF5702 domain-containing protein [Sinanaerobacter sp. ZZT-01]WRR92902.1 DUF5702 domain-containing protein [Sinanaerobacter sp. ZZT-01]
MRINKKGGASVFLMMAFVSILLVIVLLTEAISSSAARSYAMAVIELAGRSTLSNYNQSLKEDYGLFGISMEDEKIKEELLYYCEQTIHPTQESESVMKLINLQLKNFEVESDEYALTNCDVFENQIVDYMKYRVLGDILIDWSEKQADDIITQGQKQISDMAQGAEELEKAGQLMEKIKPVLLLYEDALDKTKKLEKVYQSWMELKDSDSENAAEEADKLKQRLFREWSSIQKTFYSIKKQVDEIKQYYGKGESFGENGENMMKQVYAIEEKIFYFLSVAVDDLEDVFMLLKEKEGKSKRSSFWKQIKKHSAFESDDKEQGNRILQNKSVIAYLPSQQMEQSIWEFNGFQSDNKENFLTEAKNKFLINQYIFDVFKTQLTEQGRDTFFENEVEYLLFGNFKDATNRKKAESRIFTVRASSNLIYLYSNPKKQKELAAAAASLTPGPEAVITQFVLAALWSSAEAKNDLKILLDSGSVPFFKDDDSWMLSLDSILSGKYGSTKKKEVSNGLNYSQYLSLFLFCSSKQVILVRMMDLIQINLQGRCNKGFLLCSCKGGFLLHGEVWKKRVLGKQGKLKMVRKGKVVVRHAY